MREAAGSLLRLSRPTKTIRRSDRRPEASISLGCVLLGLGLMGGTLWALLVLLARSALHL